MQINMGMGNVFKKHIRQYVMITLSHGERRPEVSQELIVSRLNSKFTCRSIIVSKENHAHGGYHYHVGLRNSTASCHTATRQIRELFPEFPGLQCNVSFHKGWNTICLYITKKDQSPLCWGDDSLSDVLARSTANTKKRIGPEFIKLLRSKQSWQEVMQDDELAYKATSSYSSLRNAYADMRASIESPHILKRIWHYMQETAGIPYTQNELQEKWVVIDWLVNNICRARYIKQPQLLIYGAPSTHKTNLVSALGQFLKIYYVPRRRDDFTGADDNYDLWVFDEWNQLEINRGTLKIVLDGQVCRLDSKYGRVIEKQKNVPMILLGNQGLINNTLDYEALSTRIKQVNFVSQLDTPITAERLAPTLYAPLREAISRDSGEQFVLEQEGKLCSATSSDRNEVCDFINTSQPKHPGNPHLSTLTSKAQRLCESMSYRDFSRKYNVSKYLNKEQRAQIRIFFAITNTQRFNQAWGLGLLDKLQ